MAQWIRNLPANAGDGEGMGSIPGSGRSPGEGNGNTLQYSFLGNPIQRSLVGCSPHGVVKSQTQLSEHTFTRKARYSVLSSFSIHSPKLVRNHFVLPESISQKIKYR